jgi:hypothetical protein
VVLVPRSQDFPLLSLGKDRPTSKAGVLSSATLSPQKLPKADLSLANSLGAFAPNLLIFHLYLVALPRGLEPLFSP